MSNDFIGVQTGNEKNGKEKKIPRGIFYCVFGGYSVILGSGDLG